MQDKETAAVAPTASKARYYDDSGVGNPDFNLPAMHAVMHKLFCRWKRLNYHVRDFETAVEHEATLLYCDYVLEGKPVFDTVAELPSVEAAVAACGPVPPSQADTTPPKRLYTDDGDLNLEVDLSSFCAALAPFFLYGVTANWQPRDFITMAKDLAASTLYDYDITASMGGLGGCQTAEEYLAAFD